MTTSNGALALLVQADAFLAGEVQARVNSVRAGAWIARSALESVVADLVRSKGCDPGRANMRTLLSCVESLYADDDPQVAANAQYAWDRLSEASHHHAYELAPTHAEVAGLVELVRELGAAADKSAAGRA